MDIAVVGTLALTVLWVRLTKAEAGRRVERAETPAHVAAPGRARRPPRRRPVGDDSRLRGR